MSLWLGYTVEVWVKRVVDGRRGSVESTVNDDMLLCILVLFEFEDN